MGLYYKKVFVLVACLLQTVWTLPARRAFDAAPAEANNLAALLNLQSAPSVDSTIKEVEHLLAADPTLPRLTRGEILDIIENITRSDLQHAFEGTNVGNRDQKAIMVVMPYSADNVQNGDIQALYTRPPITKLVGDADKQVPSKKRRPTKKPYHSSDANYLDYSAVKVAKLPSSTEKALIEEFQQQVVTESTTQSSRTTTENPFTKFIRRRKTTRNPVQQKQEEYSSTTTTTTTTTTETPRTTRRRRTTRRPTTIATTTTTTTTAPPRTTTATRKPTRRTTPAPQLSTSTFSPSGIKIVDPPTFNKDTHAFQPIATTTAPILVDEMQIPEDFKQVLKSLDILIKQSPTEATLATSSDELTEDDKLKLLIASLGAQTTTTTTTTTSEPDVLQVANNLTPEMKELLMTFGLLPDPNKDKTTTLEPEIFMEPSSMVNPNSYSSFKPLPVATGGNPNEDMEDFLAKFGLVDQKGSKRGQKAISITKPENSIPTPNLDAVPDQYKGVLEDIGLLNYKPSTSKPEIVPEESRKPDHVFVPAETGSEYATEDEINRLNKLMAVIREFERLNGTATEEDLKHIDIEGLKELVNSFNVPLDEQKGPSPVDYDVGLIKNEVKRQTTTTTTEKPVENQNANLALLADSFGGPSGGADEVTPAPTEPPKKTGFYYLVDWNTFLDIDNQKGKRVNLRFQPKIGDPKRFLSVSVP